MQGITLIEILIIIFLIFILASFVFSIGLNFYRSQELKVHSQGVLQTLRRAQLKAMSVELDSSFGVYLTDENYTLFKGNSYSERDSQYDEVFDLPQIITVSGLSEIVFLKVGGLPKGTSSYCAGTCTPCGNFNGDKKACDNQDGCSWNNRFQECSGVCTSCDNYQNQSDCEGQFGCTWYPAARGGNIILSADGNSQIININEIGRINLQ